MDDTLLSDLHWDSEFFENSTTDYDLNPSESDSENSNQDLLPDDEDSEASQSVPLNNTCALKQKFMKEVVLETVKDTLVFWQSCGMDLLLFLDAVSWGSEECIMNKQVRYAKTSLMVSDELPEILRRWYWPPRSHHFGKWAGGAVRKGLC